MAPFNPRKLSCICSRKGRSSSGGYQGQGERDSSAQYATFRPDGAFVSLDESFADRQSETGTTGTLLAAMPRAVETLEDVGKLIGRDAGAIV